MTRPVLDRVTLGVTLSRWGLFIRLQLPFLVFTVYIALGTLVAGSQLYVDPLLGVGIGLAGVASVGFLLPREVLRSSWVVAIPIVDIIAVACMRAVILPLLPSVGLLCLFPFAWIAYRFRWPALGIVLAGSVFITVLRFAVYDTSIASAAAFLNLVTLPLIATTIAVGVHIVATQLDRGGVALRRTTNQLRDSLRRANESELLLRTVLDTVNGAIAFWNAEGELVFANQPARQMVREVGFRLDVPPYAGPNVLQADKVTPIALEDQIIPRALRGDLLADHMEWLGPPGQQIAILATSKQIFDDDAVLLGTLVAAYDVTALGEAVSVREEFLTTVSHELRTPLTSIVGYTEYIEEILSEDAEALGVDAALAIINRNAQTLLGRVAQLLTVADKNFVLHRADTDVSQLISETVEPLSVLAVSAGLTCQLSVAPALRAFLDGPRVAQVLENVVSNAIKYTPRGGLILLDAVYEVGCVVVSITDTGIGMTPDEQRQVFDRFYRTATVRAQAVQGIGVGLSIVKEVVEAHEGTVSISSTPGSGTTVTIRLPSNPPATSSTPASADSTPRVPGASDERELPDNIRTADRR